MAHSRSALKRWRQSLRRQARNKAVRSATRTYVKKAVPAIEQGAEDVEASLRRAQSALDRAVKKGVLKVNAAARHKSRLMQRLAGARAAAAAAEEPPAAKPVRKTAAAKKGSTAQRSSGPKASARSTTRSATTRKTPARKS